MATDGYGNPIPAAQSFLPGQQEYQDKAMQLYTSPGGSADMARKKALGRLQSEFQTRGLGSSGIYGQAIMDQNQGYLHDMQDFAGQTALHGATVGEESRRMQEQRGWQVQDRDKAWERALQMMEHQEKNANDSKTAEMLGSMFQTGGTVLGSVYGGPVGGAVGGMAGKEVGTGLGNMGKSKKSYSDAYGGAPDTIYPSYSGGEYA